MADDLDLASLEQRLGRRFTDPGLLRQALSHRSWCAEVRGYPSNERLEFLGDAVLGLVVTDLAYRRFPDQEEGRLTDRRKAVVNEAALAEVAGDLGLGGHLLLGKGEDAAGGRGKPSILSDALEAVIGAVYVDGGWTAAQALVERLVGERLDASPDGAGDDKTALQELAARLFDAPPVYVLHEEGPDHAKRFHAVVHIAGEPWGRGEGRTKKHAEQAAAGEARRRLTEAEGSPGA